MKTFEDKIEKITSRHVMNYRYAALPVVMSAFFAVKSYASSCEILGRYECRHSTECTLDCATSPSRPYVCVGDYFCKEKKDPCEKGLSQENMRESSCERQKGCEFSPGGCYCRCEEASEPAARRAHMPACACSCGKGPPPHCSSVKS